MGILDQCPKIKEEVPLVKSYLAQFAARATVAELVNMADLAQALENGAHFPLFLLCLQQMVKLKDRDWLSDLFQLSKVNMQKMLPGKSGPGGYTLAQINVALNKLRQLPPQQKLIRARTRCWKSWKGRASVSCSLS